MNIWYDELYRNKVDISASLYKESDLPSMHFTSKDGVNDFIGAYDAADRGESEPLFDGFVEGDNLIFNLQHEWGAAEQDFIKEFINEGRQIVNQFGSNIENTLRTLGDITGQIASGVQGAGNRFAQKSSMNMNMAFTNKMELIQQYKGVNASVDIPAFTKYYFLDNNKANIKKDLVDDLNKSKIAGEVITAEKLASMMTSNSTVGKVAGIADNIMAQIISLPPHDYRYTYGTFNEDDTIPNTLILVTGRYVIRPLIVTGIQISYSDVCVNINPPNINNIHYEGKILKAGNSVISPIDKINSKGVSINGYKNSSSGSAADTVAYNPSYIKLTIQLDWARRPTQLTINKFLEQAAKYNDSEILSAETLGIVEEAKNAAIRAEEEKKAREVEESKSNETEYNKEVQEALNKINSEVAEANENEIAEEKKNMFQRSASWAGDKAKVASGLATNIKSKFGDTYSQITKSMSPVKDGINSVKSTITDARAVVTGQINNITGGISAIRNTVESIPSAVRDAKNFVDTIKNGPSRITSALSTTHDSVNISTSALNSLKDLAKL